MDLGENGSASSTYVVDQQLSKGQSKNNTLISCLYFVVFLQGLEAHAYFSLAIFIVSKWLFVRSRMNISVLFVRYVVT